MFSKSSLIPPRYLFADPSSQSMKAAAISELYLLNENTNGSSSFLARRQGRQQGVGVGAGGRWWCRIQLCPRSRAITGKLSVEGAEGQAFRQVMGSVSSGQNLPGNNFFNSCYLEPNWFHVLTESILPRWSPRMRDGVCQGWRDRLTTANGLLKLISFNFSLRSRISLETLANWRPNTKPLHLILLSTLKFLFPELTSSLQNFSQVGEFHSGKKKKIRFPFYLTRLCDYIPLELISPCLPSLLQLIRAKFLCFWWDVISRALVTQVVVYFRILCRSESPLTVSCQEVSTGLTDHPNATCFLAEDLPAHRPWVVRWLSYVLKDSFLKSTRFLWEQKSPLTEEPGYHMQSHFVYHLWALSARC